MYDYLLVLERVHGIYMCYLSWHQSVCVSANRFFMWYINSALFILNFHNIFLGLQIVLEMLWSLHRVDSCMNCNELLEKHTYRFHMLHLYTQQNNRDMFHLQCDSDPPDSFEDTVRSSPLHRILLFGNL